MLRSTRLFLSKFKGLPFAWDRLVIRTYRYTHGYPLWVKQPLAINLDTQNACNLKCKYCNVQNSYIDCPSRLPLSTIEHILNYFREKDWRISYVYCYLNGDPLLEFRLPKITKMIKDILGCKTVIYTNGSLYKNRHLLRDKNLDEVRFTVSAASPELYEKVHGFPLFHDVLKTIRWFDRTKFWNQRIFVNYILFSMNEHELPKWKKLFKDFELDVRPLHEAFSQVQSKKLSGEHGELKGKYYDYATNQDFVTRRYSGFRPCDSFASFTIDVNGNMLQCPTVNPKYHYGNVLENDIEEMWKKKLKVGVSGESCIGCTMKRPDWREIFEKYVWV